MRALSVYFKARVPDQEMLALDGKALRGTIEVGQTHGQHVCLTNSTLLNTYAEWESIRQTFTIERHITYLKTGRVAHQPTF